MPILPKLVMENGLNNLGVLSTLYLTKKNQDFFAGIFEKNKALYLVIKIKVNTYVSLEVSQQKIEALLRGKISLMKLMHQSEKLDVIIQESDSHKIPSKAYWTLLTLYMELMNRIFTVPNAYYYWNEFQYSLKR